MVIRMFSCKASVASLYHDFSMLGSVSECVLPDLGVGWGAPFSPFILNVIQTKPLTHMSTHISQLVWQFLAPLLFTSSLKERKKEKENVHHTQSLCTKEVHNQPNLMLHLGV